MGVISWEHINSAVLWASFVAWIRDLVGRYGAAPVDIEVSVGAREIEALAGAEHDDPTGLLEDRGSGRAA